MAKARLKASIVAYCANCDDDLAESTEEHIGKRFHCPNEPTHLAVVVQSIESSRRWLRVELTLLRWQSCRLSLSQGQLFKNHEEYYVLLRLVVLIGLVVSACYFSP